MVIKRHSHNLSHTKTMTANMGLIYPSALLEVYPGDSFKFQATDLTRFLPQVAPTMHDVFIGIDTYQVPMRQLFDKLKLSWDDFLTGGEDGMTNVEIPHIIIPETGYEPGSLADFLGLPTNFINPETGEHVIVGAGLKVSAMPVIAYMHIINENYRDQNFIKKLDFTKYEDFLNGTYEFQDASGKPLGYNILVNGIFPKAWSRDYFGRALPNTQRGPEATLPINGTIDITPTLAPVLTYSDSSFTYNGTDTIYLCYSGLPQEGQSNSGWMWKYSLNNLPEFTTSFYKIEPGTVLIKGQTYKTTPIGNYQPQPFKVNDIRADGNTSGNYIIDYVSQYNILLADISGKSYKGTYQASGTYADLKDVNADLQDATASSILAFRLAARMQAFGEVLQRAGARAVEFTMAMFGVRIPDDRIQRPIFHGSFRLPVAFTEVLQTSSTDGTSPQGNLAGHGITGGTNRPIHIKVNEHGYLITLMHVMPRSQYHNILPKLYDRFNRFDLPNPMFQHIGEQGIKRKEIYPNSEHPNKYFGFVTRYSELMHVPSTLHGQMKSSFLHWNMARVYTEEPVLSAAWRYEKPTNRSFAVLDEDQMQICIGYTIQARRPFARNPRPGITHV